MAQQIPTPPEGFVPLGSTQSNSTTANSDNVPSPPEGFVPLDSPVKAPGTGFMSQVVGSMIEGAHTENDRLQQEKKLADSLDPDQMTGLRGVGTGIGKGTLESMEGIVRHAGNAIGDVLGVPDAGEKAVASMFPAVGGASINLDATTPSQSIGKGVENIAEFAAGDEALTGLAKAAKVVELADKYPAVAKTLEVARKHPVIAKMITEGAKGATVGGAQGAVKGAAHGDAAEEAEGGVIGGAVGGAAGGALESLIAGKPSQTILKILGIGGLTPEEALTKAGRPSVYDQRFTDSLEKAMPLVKEFPKSQIKSVGDFEDMLDERANRLWMETIQPQVASNANAVIEGAPIAENIRKALGEGTNELFPTEAAPVEAMAEKFANSKLSLDKANNYLKTINAKLKAFYKLSPDARYAAETTNGNTAALEAAADGLRDSIYSKLEELGEENPRELRQQYGALRDLQRVFSKRATVADRQVPVNLTQILGGIEALHAVLTGQPLAAAAGVVVPMAAKVRNSPESLIRQGIEEANQPGASAARKAAGALVEKTVPNISSQLGRIYFRASDDTMHSIPYEQLGAAQEQDPGLKVIPPPRQ